MPLEQIRLGLSMAPSLGVLVARLWVSGFGIWSLVLRLLGFSASLWWLGQSFEVHPLGVQCGSVDLHFEVLLGRAVLSFALDAGSYQSLLL
jgi:hypothetical protein